jgi:metal-responsive CopG/Arc/MetJ family transcriptional regulator
MSVYDFRYTEKNPKRLSVITIKIDPDLLGFLDRYAVNHGLNRSEAIRKAIVRMILAESEQDVEVRVVSGGRL